MRRGGIVKKVEAVCNAGLVEMPCSDRVIKRAVGISEDDRTRLQTPGAKDMKYAEQGGQQNAHLMTKRLSCVYEDVSVETGMKGRKNEHAYMWWTALSRFWPSPRSLTRVG
jgi:hypothetical protein